MEWKNYYRNALRGRQPEAKLNFYTTFAYPVPVQDQKLMTSHFIASATVFKQIMLDVDEFLVGGMLPVGQIWLIKLHHLTAQLIASNLATAINSLDVG